MTFVYGLQYFRGVRAAAGSRRAAALGFGRYLVKRSSDRLKEGHGAPLAAWSRFRTAVAVDWTTMTEGRAKYLGESQSRRFGVDLVTKIGTQMMFAVRVMHLMRDSGLRLLAQVVSRLIRHLYAAEIHWDADLAPGISIIHGNGLVVSHSARVAEGAVLFHHVTLGMGLDPATGERGAPTLQRNVHVGPGATLIGPIIVGEGSKIMAGSVLQRSVPPHSLVRPAAVEVVSRQTSRGDSTKDETLRS
jgi:serine O-acetyltransferase